MSPMPLPDRSGRSRRFHSFSIALAALAALAPATRAQVRTWSAHGTRDSAEYGSSVARLGDLDGDGIPEWIVAERYGDGPNFVAAGRVELFRGSDGALLREHEGSSDQAHCGSAVVALDDQDGDGVDDYAVGESDYWVTTLGGRCGRIGIRSGATGAGIVAIDGIVLGEYLGTNLAAIDDFDGDGKEDLLSWRGVTAQIVSSTGARLLTLATLGDVISAAARIDDVDGDGVREIVVGSETFSGAKGREGVLHRFSGATGALQSTFIGANAKDALGWAIAACGDHDGDGIGDLIVSGRVGNGLSSPNGFVSLRSSATWKALWRVDGATQWEMLGYRVAAAGDWNGDGVEDVLATGKGLGISVQGGVQVRSGKDGALLHQIDGTFTTSEHDHEFGEALAGGDFDGDGVGDALVGALRWHDTTAWLYVGAAHLYRGCPASATSYGAGFAGTLGVPALSVSGVPALGSTITLSATNSLGATTSGLLLVGAAPAAIPLRRGATLLVDPNVAPFSIEPIVVPATGWSDVDTIVDDPALAFADFFLQVLELDPGAPGGVSLTNGLQLRIGYDL